MPFYLYSYTFKENNRVYTREKQITPFAGRYGLLTKTIKQEMPTKSPYKWHYTSKDIMRKVKENPENYEIIIDLKPIDKEGKVSLYLLKEAWGYTFEKWTPIALLLQSLYTDYKDYLTNPEEFKKSFEDKIAENELNAEFLYLNGGTKEGNWGWGRVGSVNGALLNKKAFEYFTGELAERLLKYDEST